MCWARLLTLDACGLAVHSSVGVISLVCSCVQYVETVSSPLANKHTSIHFPLTLYRYLDRTGEEFLMRLEYVFTAENFAQDMRGFCILLKPDWARCDVLVLTSFDIGLASSTPLGLSRVVADV